MVLLSVSYAYAQPPRGGSHREGPRSEYRDHGHRGHKKGHKGGPKDSHRDGPKDVHKGGGPKGVVHHHGGPRRPIQCTGDWQELWNGRHVRLKMNQVWICRKNGDEFLRGDEVILLPLGSYCVRRGDLWHIYDEDGDWFTGISSRYEIEQLWNGCYLFERDGKFYVANEEGDRIFGVWGDWVELMDNGLFRCHRNGRNYYYDKAGNQRD